MAVEKTVPEALVVVKILDIRMKNPNLTPLNGLDVGLIAHNKG